jgi:thiosulfate/3-mercaptopyruvate sulfurtransferase
MRPESSFRLIVLCILLSLALPVPTSFADESSRDGFAHPEFIVRAAALRARLDEPGLVLIDTRRAADYRMGHIPGAVHLAPGDLERTEVLANGETVANLVMHPEDITPVLQAAGIDEEDRIVIYDDGRHILASRVWWMLDYYGHEHIAVLEGGYAAWKAADGPTSRASPEVTRGSFVARPDPNKHADYDYVQAHLGSEATAVCDALSAQRYAEGAIPGALNLPAMETLGAGGESPLLKSAAELRSMLAELDIGPDEEIVFYCGAGYMAAQDYFIARALGVERVRLYDGSLADWRARGGQLEPAGGRR